MNSMLVFISFTYLFLYIIENSYRYNGRSNTNSLFSFLILYISSNKVILFADVRKNSIEETGKKFLALETW